MDPDLRDMLSISRAAGRDPTLVQGGGGNTSVKTDDGRLMYVKASGTALGEMTEGRGYRLVDVARCVQVTDDEELAALAEGPREEEVLRRFVDACVDDLPGRPSVEAGLHALLGRCVVHTHPSVLNGVLCARNGREVLAELFGDLAPPYLVVEYAGAGYALARRLRAEFARYERANGCLPEVVFLENHGLFVSTREAERAIAVTKQIIDAAREAAARAATGDHALPFRPPAPEREDGVVAHVTAAMRRFYAEVLGRPVLVCFESGRVVHQFLALPAATQLAQMSPLVPDQVVYCRERPVWFSPPADPPRIQDALTEALTARSAGADTPLCVLVEGVGLFCAAVTPRLLRAASEAMSAALESLSVAARFGGPRGLDEAAVAFVRGWEAERFRHAMAAGERPGDSLCGKVAVVSGAGSGIGRGVSLFLAGRGVHVVLADIDREATQETRRRAEALDDPGEARPVEADVTSEESVRALFRRSVREFGGVDLLVNCAGIAPVHPLVEFPSAAWQKTLDINLTGYFLMAREAARRMLLQGTGGSIINVSSKTGLEASRNHSAYNATKAAEIHLARGWALELAEHGIRVNCICPGNVFTESKIWNEDYVRALAEKRGLKPEEVMPYYIGLTALKKEITWDDVGEAVAFLAGDGASKITGQTLVVDGGQVFVR